MTISRRPPGWVCAAVAALSIGGLSATPAAAAPLTFGPPSPIDSGNAMAGLSCPSQSFCAAGDNLGNVLTSTNPAGGGGAWKSAAVDSGAGIRGIGCASSALCVAGDPNGNLFVSTNPTGGAGAWTTVTVPGQSGPILAVSCPSSSFCAGGDGGGVLTSTNPAGGTAAWTYTPIAATGWTGVSCPSSAFCVGVDGNGNIWSSNNPTGGASTWSQIVAPPGSAFPEGIACPSTRLCVAVDSAGHAITSTDPASGSAAHWTLTDVDGSNLLDGVSCPTDLFCVASDTAGNALMSDNPAGGVPAWTVQKTAVPSLNAVSCSSPFFCAAVDNQNVLLASVPPPVLGQSVDVRAVSGTVRVKPPHGHKLVTLTKATQIPVNATLDTTHGTVALTSATNRTGGTQSGQFNGGMFIVHQARSSALTEIALTGGNLGQCEKLPPGGSARSRHRRRLFSNVTGQFRTRGRNSAATVRGTKWTMTDTCSGTLTAVQEGTVVVRDFTRRQNIVLQAGKSYLAKPPH